jgi:DNA-binding winged helix-turn-helix (wHTH) protein
MKAFQAFRLDTLNQCLRRGDERLPITPKAYDVLRYLVEHPGRLITPDEILGALWPETYVQPEVLRKYILEIRKVLGDRLDRPLFVETIPKRGYQFVALVSEEGSAGAESAWPHDFTGILAGREAPLQRLETLVRKASNALRQIMFITGEAGIGKTSLLDAFERTATRNANAWMARGHCVERFGGKEPYYPVLEALGQLARGAGTEAFNKTLARHASTWLVQFPALLNPISSRKREPVAAEEHRKAAFKIIACLGDSYQAGHPLRETMLSARPLSRLLQISRNVSD